MLLAGNFQAEENVHEFQGFVTICESFLCKIWRYDIINMFFPRKSYSICMWLGLHGHKTHKSIQFLAYVLMQSQHYAKFRR